MTRATPKGTRRRRHVARIADRLIDHRSDRDGTVSATKALVFGGAAAASAASGRGPLNVSAAVGFGALALRNARDAVADHRSTRSRCLAEIADDDELRLDVIVHLARIRGDRHTTSAARHAIWELRGDHAAVARVAGAANVDESFDDVDLRSMLTRLRSDRIAALIIDRTLGGRLDVDAVDAAFTRSTEIRAAGLDDIVAVLADDVDADFDAVVTSAECLTSGSAAPSTT